MTDLNDKALKPCPFCGGPSDFVGRPGAGYEVECKHCGAKSGWGDYGYQVEAKWNRRSLTSATPPDAAELIQRLEEGTFGTDVTKTDPYLNALMRQAATALRLSAGGGWRPMDSAPHNQTVILGWHDWRDGQWCMEIGAASTGQRYDTGFSSVSRHGSATHWLPLSHLPASPTVEAGR